MVKSFVWLNRLYLAGIIVFAAWRAWQGDFFIALSVLVGLVIGFCARPFILKRALLNSLARWDARPASIEEFPRLDRERVERLQREWEALGFEACGVFAGGNNNPAFSLLLRHPTEGAIAEVSQVFLLKRALPVVCGAFSYWGDARAIEELAAELSREEGGLAPLSSPQNTAPLRERVIGEDELKVWSYATHNRASNAYWKVLRHPRVLGTRLPPNTHPAELWRVHLERRAHLDERIPAPRIENDLVRVMQTHAVVLTQLWRFRVRRAVAIPRPRQGRAVRVFG